MYSPDEEMLPTAGLRDHVTDVFDVPETVAVNCWVAPWFGLAEDGLTPTEMPDVRVRVAAADLAGFAIEVAVTVTVC